MKPTSTLALALMFSALSAQAQTATAPAAAASTGSSAVQARVTSLPAKGLFSGNQLTAAARAKLTDLIINAIGLQVEVALVVPRGPWTIDGSGSGSDERDLTPERLQALKSFLQQRGVDPKKIYVESRIDEKLKEPRLDVQVMGRPAAD